MRKRLPSTIQVRFGRGLQLEKIFTFSQKYLFADVKVRQSKKRTALVKASITQVLTNLGKLLLRNIAYSQLVTCNDNLGVVPYAICLNELVLHKTVAFQNLSSLSTLLLKVTVNIVDNFFSTSTMLETYREFWIYYYYAYLGIVLKYPCVLFSPKPWRRSLVFLRDPVI